MNVNRRQFVRTSTAAALAASLPHLTPTLAVAEEIPAVDNSTPLPIIDTHQHLWDLDRFRLPWLAAAKELNRSFVTGDYLEATRGLNVVKAVYMEVDVAPEQQVDETEYVLGLCQDPAAPTAAAVISGRPASDQFKNYITRFKDSPYIRGVRQVLHAADAKPGLCLQDDFVRGIRLLGEMGLSFDLCMRPAELLDGAKLADECPDTRFIVDHCGNADPKAFGDKQRANAADHQADQWRGAMEQLAKRKNVVCKISGIVARAPKDNWTPDDLAPIIDHCLDQFGPNRVLFGSDWPVCTLVTTYRRWLEALLEVTNRRGRELQQKLLHDNAARFYELAAG